MSKVLSILVSINVQAKLDINLGSQGKVITNQGGWLSNRVFMQANHMQFYKAGYWVVFIKTRTETCIKGWGWTCRLQSLLGCPVLRAQGRGTGPRSPAHSTTRWQALLRSLRGLQRTQTSTPSIHRIKDLSLSLNREHMKYGVQSIIFECFLNGMVETKLREAW